MSLSESQMTDLEALLLEVESGLARCEDQLLKIDEASRSLTELWQKALSIVPADSDEWRALDRIYRSRGHWWNGTTSGYVDPSNCEHFSKLRIDLKNVLEKNEPEFLRHQKRSRDQYFFSAGEIYEAKKAIFTIMKKAKISLAIVDQYLDETVFDYLESLDSDPELKLLTGLRKPIFKTLFVPFAAKRGKSEARFFQDCHDRFLILDDKEIIHLGTSINRIGEKAFMMSKVMDSNEIARIVKEFWTWWGCGQPIL